MHKSLEIYQQQKMDFLDNLSPDDLVNGENFNQIEDIIDKINQNYHGSFLRNEDHHKFIKKAFENLFRQNSLVIAKAIDLAEIYLNERTQI
ncbi:MAG: hypothetical protein ACJA02_001121 [Myxococcota bacterium]|jgi:hypothetical protein